ncbi:hypothetical protein KKF05_03575 [Patescibacteria group bacterium]|nr:hypothetical protein [Patescibacteria group bacterium]MBU1029580.1 hypothetical protein [Patescibacteria group bacterium]MBU1915830.1 hypothetical protein [Patescibacteria group bacterium]
MENLSKSYQLETGCCPIFNPEPWDGQEHEWRRKLFIKRHIPAVFHIPLGFGRIFTTAWKILQKNEAIPVTPMWLSEEKSAWGSDLLLESTKDLPGEDMVQLSGTFFTKMFEGSYRNIPTWLKEMQRLIEVRGKKIERLYFWYTTCPKCAKIYGKNYVVLVAKI